MTAHPNAVQTQPTRSARRIVGQLTGRASDDTLVEVTRYSDGSTLVQTRHHQNGGGVLVCSAEAARTIADAIVTLDDDEIDVDAAHGIEGSDDAVR